MNGQIVEKPDLVRYEDDEDLIEVRPSGWEMYIRDKETGEEYSEDYETKEEALEEMREEIEEKEEENGEEDEEGEEGKEEDDDYDDYDMDFEEISSKQAKKPSVPERDLAAWLSRRLGKEIKDKALESVLRNIVFSMAKLDWGKVEDLIHKSMPETKNPTYDWSK